MNKAVSVAVSVIVAMATLPSCSVGWRGAESSEITEEAAVDAILKEHFPEIFRAKEAGVVHVDGIIKSVNRKTENSTSPRQPTTNFLPPPRAHSSMGFSAVQK